MNIQQLEYIVAIDTYRHFAKSAEATFVTQPTLSMMVQKLEEELEVKIFDRSKQPVVPTKIGEEIIMQARKALAEIAEIKSIVNNDRGLVSGTLRIGVIPTLAPYLLPLFLKNYISKYPLVKMKVTEMISEQIVEAIVSGKLDAGLMATPLKDSRLKENRLFYEKFYAYVSQTEPEYQEIFLQPDNINTDHLWLLEEGHCFRSQIVKLCEIKQSSNSGKNLDYEAGSIETLIRIVEQSGGITIIPEMATHTLTDAQKLNLRPFVNPSPVREVSIVSHREFVKKKLLNTLAEEINASLPQSILDQSNSIVIDI